MIDIRGPIAENTNGKAVLDTKKSAVLMLTDGLKEIGDEFGIFRFTGSGKDQCKYYIFIDFDEGYQVYLHALNYVLLHQGIFLTRCCILLGGFPVFFRISDTSGSFNICYRLHNRNKFF